MKTSLAPCRRLAAVSLIALSTLNAGAAVVFQADFNGSGSRTGNADDIVAVGGAGVIVNTDPGISNVIASIASGTALSVGGGSYLRLNDQGAQTGTRVAGVAFTPASADKSFDSWYADTSGTALGHDTLNGGFDFLFRTTGTGLGATSNYRFFDLNPTGSSGFRLALFSAATDRLTLALIQNGGAGDIARATSSALIFTANSTYRIAATVSTNASGIVTVNLYLAAGDTAIDTSSTTHRIATASSSAALDASDSISSSFNSAAGFNFGLTQNATDDVKTIDLDSFRIYNSVPSSFDSVSNIPEPGSFAALLGGLIGLGVCVVRRRR